MQYKHVHILMFKVIWIFTIVKNRLTIQGKENEQNILLYTLGDEKMWHSVQVEEGLSYIDREQLSAPSLKSKRGAGAGRVKAQLQ